MNHRVIFGCASAWAITCAIGLGAVPTPAAAAPAAGADPGAGAVAEVVVTAQKRSQRLQDVPVVVTVFNAQKLQENEVRSVNDLTTITPGLTTTTNQTEGTTIARLRGVGNVADNPGLEDAVGLYIDGVYRPRNGVSFNDLGELSDIEVLKGPQGTLFGKNTIAGVIQVTTKRPSFTFGALGEVTVQNYNGYGGSAAVTGPLVGDVLAARIYVADRQRDGYIPVKAFAAYPGGPTPNIPAQNDEHVFTTRDQLLYQPNSNFDINLIADYSKRDDHCCAAVLFQDGYAASLQNAIFPGTVPEPVSPHNMTAYLQRTDIEHITDAGVSAEAHWKTPWFNNATLTSITAYRDNHDASGGDTSATGANTLYTDPKSNYIHFRQFSEELQYKGSTDRLDWQVGAFFSHELLDNGAYIQFGPELGAELNVLTLGNLPAAGFPANEGAIDIFHQVEDGQAIYTQEEFKVTDHFSIIGGLRYTWEHKTLQSIFNNTDTAGLCSGILALLNGGHAVPYSDYVNIAKAAPANSGLLGIACLVNPAFKALGTTNQALTEGALTGTLKAQYKFDSTKMVYASYSRGNLVGGFNLAEVTLPVTGSNAPNTSLAPQTDTAFPGEWVDAYELGAKTQWFGRRLSLNGAVFYQAYDNHQLNAYTGTQFVEFTIPRALAEGVELEAVYSPLRGVNLNAGVTYADTYYPNDQRNRAALQGPGSNLYLLPGQRLTYAPLWSIVAGASVQRPLTDGFDWTGAIDAKWSSDYQVGSDEDPTKLQKAFTIVNGSIGIITKDQKFALTVWATNLFNQYYKQTAYDGTLQTFSTPPAAAPSLNNYYAFPGQPQFFGATIRVKY